MFDVCFCSFLFNNFCFLFRLIFSLFIQVFHSNKTEKNGKEISSVRNMYLVYQHTIIWCFNKIHRTYTGNNNTLSYVYIVVYVLFVSKALQCRHASTLFSSFVFTYFFFSLFFCSSIYFAQNKRKIHTIILHKVLLCIHRFPNINYHFIVTAEQIKHIFTDLPIQASIIKHKTKCWENY